MANKKKKTSNFVNKPFDFILFITVILLLALGLIMVLSASSPLALAETGNNSYYYFNRQLVFALIGIVAMLFISKINYGFYKKFYKIAYIVSIIILLLVIIPGVGVEVNGAKRWVKLIGIQFQPSEIAKIGLIIFYAVYLTENKEKLKGIFQGFVKPLLILAPIILILLLIQDHLSASIIIILVTSIIMIVAGSKLIHFLTAGTIGVGLGTTALMTLAKVTGKGGFRIARITSFLDPWADAQDTGWQIIQSLYAIGSGGLFGVGLRSK